MQRMTVPEFNAARAKLLGSLTGDGLELGAGRGENFAYLSPALRWHGLEPNQRRAAILESRAIRHGHTRKPIRAVAENTQLPPASMDVIFATFLMCSVGDMQAVLAEARRVLRPSGRLVLIDHVASSSAKVRRAQSFISPISAALSHGCRLDCDPLPELETAGFVTESAQKFAVKVGLGIAVPGLLYAGRR